MTANIQPSNKQNIFLFCNSFITNRQHSILNSWLSATWELAVISTEQLKSSQARHIVPRSLGGPQSMGLCPGGVYLQSRQNQMCSLWEVFRHLATLLNLHHVVLLSDVHGVFPKSELTKLLDKTLPGQAADVIVLWMCCVLWQKWGKLKLTWVTARLVFISPEKKWDTKKRRETSDLHTDLRTRPDSEATPYIPHSIPHITSGC